MSDVRGELPWRVEWTRFGESMGYDSRSVIVDARGKTIVSLGSGASARIAEDERLASMIVSAVNSTYGAKP